MATYVYCDGFHRINLDHVAVATRCPVPDADEGARYSLDDPAGKRLGICSGSALDAAAESAAAHPARNTQADRRRL